MTSRKILVLGNSHTHMVKSAVKKYGTPDPIEVECRWLYRTEAAKHGDTSREEALALVAALSEEDLVALTVMGTTHNIVGILNHEIPFSLAESPSGPVPVPDGHMVIPMQLMRDYLSRLTERFTYLDEIQAVAKCPIVHYMPPPPKDGTVPLRKGSYRGQSIAEIGLSPKASRLALWRLENDVVRRFFAARGVASLDIPPEAITAEGYLADAFHAQDFTHANEDYGRLILNGLVEQITRDRKAPAH